MKGKTMRGPEKLAEQIDRIVDDIYYENAMTDPEFAKEVAENAILSEKARKARHNNDLLDDIPPRLKDLSPWQDEKSLRNAMSALEAHVRANWTIREIIFFSDFTHGGTYDAGMGWRINFAGFTAPTAKGQKALIDLFEHLCREAYFFVGAKLYAEADAKFPLAVLLTRFDRDGDDTLDMTFNALIRSLPPKAEK